jgi:hypothetical protein
MKEFNLEFLKLLSTIPNKNLTHTLKVAKGKYKYPSSIREVLKKISL